METSKQITTDRPVFDQVVFYLLIFFTRFIVCQDLLSDSHILQFSSSNCTQVSTIILATRKPIFSLPTRVAWGLTKKQLILFWIQFTLPLGILDKFRIEFLSCLTVCNTSWAEMYYLFNTIGSKSIINITFFPTRWTKLGLSFNK